MNFDIVNSQIQKFISEHQGDLYSLNDTTYKLPLSDAVFCATDIPRNRAFFEAIRKAVIKLKTLTEKIRVVYAGSGTGILGIFALALGAKDCLFLEHNPHSLEFSKKLVTAMGFAGQVKFIECDATKIQFSKPYDLLLSETLTSGFVREDFAYIIRHLRKFGEASSIIIPEKFSVRLEEKNENGKTVAEHNFEFVSSADFELQEIKLQNSATTQLTWNTTTTLYDDVIVQPGECVSFMNEMTQDLKNIVHPLFTITPKENS